MWTTKGGGEEAGSVDEDKRKDRATGTHRTFYFVLAWPLIYRISSHPGKHSILSSHPPGGSHLHGRSVLQLIFYHVQIKTLTRCLISNASLDFLNVAKVQTLSKTPGTCTVPEMGGLWL